MIYWYDKSAKCWSFKQRLDHKKSYVNDEADESGLVTTRAHPLASEIGNVWEMGGWLWCFKERPNLVGVRKLFPSCHLDIQSYWEHQWFSMEQALVQPLTLNGTSLAPSNQIG